MTKRTGKRKQKPIRKRDRVWFERKVAELKAEAERLPEARQDELKRKLAAEE